jgi:hypothetical protein
MSKCLESSIICSPAQNALWFLNSGPNNVTWNKNNPVFDNAISLQIQFSYHSPPDNLTETHLITYTGINKNMSFFEVETAHWLVPDAVRDDIAPYTLNIMMDGSSTPISSAKFNIMTSSTEKKGNEMSRAAVIAICAIVPAFFVILAGCLLTRRKKDNGRMVFFMFF